MDSYISHDKFVSVNSVREYNEMKEEIKNYAPSVEYIIEKKYSTILIIFGMINLK